MNKIQALLGFFCISAGLSSFMANEASAIVFDFGGNGSNGRLGQESESFTVDGLFLEATAFDRLGSSRNVTRRNAGLGVRLPGIFGGFDSPQIDGLGLDETLSLTFGTSGDTRVALNSATFSRVDGNDEFTLFTDGDAFLTNASIPNSGIFDFTSFVRPDRTASGFNFQVTDFNDNYFLRSVDVETVPEPLTVIGTALALGFGASFRKSKRSSC